MIVPGGGVALDGRQWLSSRPKFLLPVQVLSHLFRRLLLQKLRAAAGAVGAALTAQATQFAANVLPIIREVQAAGDTSCNAIARQLNARNAN
jgi:hypothetical protein